EQAKQAFLELLDQVQTEKAADEVNYWIARLDFYYLDNKEEGISRLWEVIKKTPIDSATGAPVDSTYQTYFDYYGRMCYKLGDEKRSDFQREAFIYFSKAASIDNPNRAMSLYRLALLSNIDAETAMDYASQAWALKEELSQLYQRYVARILYQSYQKKGEFDEAVRWYRRYIELK
ncbi:MAG: hypothetical protein ONB05_06705, partial [candidate division KSB1 bacterium]|nr:hypothetical protein [candidate division KSB1 bacterium]